MTCKEIIKKWLEDNGYTGLFNDRYDGCGCGLNDLCPCDGEIAECQPAYERWCIYCPEKEACVLRLDGAEYCYHKNKVEPNEVKYENNTL